MDRGAWQATVHGFSELNTTEVTEHVCMQTGLTREPVSGKPPELGHKITVLETGGLDSELAAGLWVRKASAEKRRCLTKHISGQLPPLIRRVCGVT